MPRITTESGRQTVITTFEMTPATCQDLLEELTSAYNDFICRQEGFISCALHVNDAQTRIASYSQWKRREDFQAMLRSPEMRQRMRKVLELARSFEPVMYDVAETMEG